MICADEQMIINRRAVAIFYLSSHNLYIETDGLYISWGKAVCRISIMSNL